MPFKSKKQERWAFANDMPWAEEWAGKTPKDIPESKSEGFKDPYKRKKGNGKGAGTTRRKR